MNILGIETSCDETAAAIVQDGRKILSSVVSSQILYHRPYAGVVPELASRAHVLSINAVIERSLKQAKFSWAKLDAIGVTIGPGLVGSLLVGRMTAVTLGWITKLPVIGVNHIEGHLLSPLLATKNIRPPFLGLVVSGGHTELIHVPAWGKYFLLGRTRDDAAGEAFDKVARMLNLEYPGGPVIDRLAKEGNPEKFPFPRPWLPGCWDFSFSGLKTAVMYRLRQKKKWSLTEKKHLCASFQQSVVDILVGKTLAAARALKVRTVVIGGGVAANSQLRDQFGHFSRRSEIRVVMAPASLCTDNAAMIAAAAFFLHRYRKPSPPQDLKVQPQLHLPFAKSTTPQFQLADVQRT